ncbi:unnamed protein product [Allacma fusca]|uniref:Uncharacterized protein n=1 Tax=Allacma fusca TaxID=39272 RepID=A0A8J2P0M0_9HEXA|nr:unnamed protein product [Allacma fusca]
MQSYQNTFVSGSSRTKVAIKNRINAHLINSTHMCVAFKVGTTGLIPCIALAMAKAKESYFARKFRAEKVFGTALVRTQDKDQSFLKARRQSIYVKESIIRPLPEVVRKCGFTKSQLEINDATMENR